MKILRCAQGWTGPKKRPWNSWPRAALRLFRSLMISLVFCVLSICLHSGPPGKVPKCQLANSWMCINYKKAYEVWYSSHLIRNASHKKTRIDTQSPNKYIDTKKVQFIRKLQFCSVWLFVIFQFCAEPKLNLQHWMETQLVFHHQKLTKMLIQKHVLVGKITSTISWLQREMELAIQPKSSPPSGCLCHDLTAFSQNDPFVTSAAWGLWMDYRRNVQHCDYRADKLELVPVPPCLESPHPPPLLFSRC